MSIYYVLLWVLGGLMHLWTVYIAYSISGAFMGIISFFFPIISEIIIGFIGWNASGFSSPYIQWLIVLVSMWAFYYLIAIIIGISSSKQEKFQG